MELSKKYKKIIRKMAEERFPGEAEDIVEKAALQYEEFWKVTPDIGGSENRQFKDLDFLIAFFSFYEACGHRIGVQELDDFTYEAMIKDIEAASAVMGWDKPMMKPMITKMYTEYIEQINDHVAKGEWGNTWRIEMNPEGHKEGFAIHTRMCPNVDFCRAHGYEDFLPHVCKQDYRIAEAMNGILIRNHTIPLGSDYCDWWYFGNNEELPEEAKERLARNV
ncbi:MAG: L-2-amino-thiazoline-4-carboxylic acid hydrolase [Oscillospiraceae bacterium]|nr:L-2-amino-thiazoline-4-carboxylic acid hydrolase [Oscillospiraceae bacterium]